jgi:hypothetical protein
MMRLAAREKPWRIDAETIATVSCIPETVKRKKPEAKKNGGSRSKC